MIWICSALLVFFESGLINLCNAWYDGFFTWTRHKAFPEYSEMRLVGFRYKVKGKPQQVNLIMPVTVKRNETKAVGRWDLPEARLSYYGAHTYDDRIASLGEPREGNHQDRFAACVWAKAGEPLQLELIYRQATVTDVELIVEYV